MRLHIKDTKAGDLFHEDRYPAKFKAIEDCREVNEDGKNGYEVKALVLSGYAPMADENGIVDFFESFQCGPYGLHLSRFK